MGECVSDTGCARVINCKVTSARASQIVTAISLDTRKARPGNADSLGVVSKLWRYPVKSMRGEPCICLDLDERGVVGDRSFAICDADGKIGSGKTTTRFIQIDGLLDFRAGYRNGVPVITCPDGRELRGDDVDVNTILSEMLGNGVSLVREGEVPHLDAGAVHIVTTASLSWLSAALPDAVIDERRFRPNLLVDAAGVGRVETDWLGETIRIGREVKLRVTDPTERCRMVTLGQDDLPVDPRVLRRIGREADLELGVYAEVVIPGRISTGDEILLEAG